ncbi:unnamed protein product (macronuclear) [Paramecium tetraurelia]|uniref:Uncharacterized protein n=1 Tax=Paramecium tetraurelia TaxID=5888 RepID=A0CHC5_PARTE|nr:uncharacterized protein GSPATT00038294001 [Paramecium tetraurelia]CAK70192.1 unnamed protein product [Paramecium tetraurelia]|eukprot:XP_001437589.1 hypothetical protein (macronuclear) [Paramecium tetraurelia strain d4-2]
MKTISENKSFVQHIKQKQDEFKKTLQFPAKKEPLLLQQPNFTSLTSPNQRREQTPNQRKAKIESTHPLQIGENSCSPTLFRTPQISLHHEYNKKGAHQRQPSHNRSRNENISTIKERREHNADSVTRDYSKVLEEVMKKYRLLKTELVTKDKEVQKTQFYKDEWLKEKVCTHSIQKRNEIIQERNKNLKMKLLKIMELVQQDQLQSNFESEGIIAGLQTENKYLRQMLHLYDVTDVSEQLQQLESEQDHEVDQIDNILNVFLGDLRTIEKNRKEKKDNSQQGFYLQSSLAQFNSLSLTVLNKQSSLVDLSEDKLLMEQQ